MPTVRTTAFEGQDAPALLAILEGTHGAVLPLRGEIGHPQVEMLVRRALGLLAEARTCLVLDLQRVTHWDYRCLPALWTLAQRFRLQGGSLQLVGANRYLSTILRMGGLDSLVAASRASAVEAVRVGRRRGLAR